MIQLQLLKVKMAMGVKMDNKKICLSILLVLFFAISNVIATTYKSLSIQEIIERSDIAFQGKVTEVTVELKPNSDGVEEPWTIVSFEVLTSLNGDLGETHSLEFFGGTTDNKTIVVEAMPNFRVDEEVLIFAYDAVYYSPIVGFSQGLFKLSEQGWQSESGKWLAIDEEVLTVDDVSSEDTQAVVDFVAQEFANANGGEQ